MRFSGHAYIGKVLVCTLFVSCTSMQQSVRDEVHARISRAQFVAIDGWVYRICNTANDTLTCVLMRVSQDNPDAGGAPLSVYQGSNYLFDRTMCETLELHPGTTLERHLDTVRVPIAALTSAGQSDAPINPAIVLGILSGVLIIGLMYVVIDSFTHLRMTFRL